MVKCGLPNLLNRNRREKDVGIPEKPPVKSAKSEASTETAATAATSAPGRSSMGSGLLGSAVKSLLKHFDSKALGVKFVLGDTHIDAFHGRISVDGLTILNPEGFNSEYLLKAGKMILDVDMKTLLTSRGKTLELEEVLLDDLDVFYEMSLKGSNVDAVMKRLEKYQDKNAEQEAIPIVHKVLLRNIGAKAVTTALGDHGPALHLGDICYEDFYAEVGAHSIMDGVSLVLETLLKSIVASLFGKERCRSAWSFLDEQKARCRAAMSKLYQQVAGLCSCCDSAAIASAEEELIVESHV